MYLRIIILTLALALALPGLAQKKKRGGKKVKKVELKDADRINVERMFIEASKAKMINDYPTAIQLFGECLRIDPTNHAVCYELGDIYLRTGQNQRALLFARKAHELNDENKWYAELLAQSFASTGNFKEAASIYSKLIKIHPSNPDYRFNQAYMFENDGSFDDALKVYDELEHLMGINEMVTMHKRVIHLKEGNPDKAILEIRKLIAVYPDVPRYHAILGEMYENTGDEVKALESYEKILDIDPGNPKALLAIANYHQRSGNKEAYVRTLETVFRNPAMDVDKKVAILFSYFEYFIPEQSDEEKKNEAYSLAEIMVEAHPDKAAAHAIYGDFLFQDDSLQAAREHYQVSIGIEGAKYTVWKNLMLIDAELQEYDSLLVHSEEALTIFPNQTLVYYFNGAANIRLKKYEAAIASFEQALAMGSDNSKLKADIYSNCGDAYHELGKDAESDSCYDRSLELDAGNEFVLNNYAYYLSLRNERLVDAERMASQANQIAPNNSAFQDTYGWILFQQERYEEAREWLEESLKNGGKDRPVILEHYGDILFKLGNTEEAIKYWQQAKDHGSESKSIDKKIADKQFYE
jgi:tetratricopeptide (TPR) repeat protein